MINGLFNGVTAGCHNSLNAEAETPFLNKLVIDSLEHNKQLFYGYEVNANDPRSAK